MNLDITKVNEDKMREVLVYNENVENKIGPEGDVRSEKIIKEKNWGKEQKDRRRKRNEQETKKKTNFITSLT